MQQLSARKLEKLKNLIINIQNPEQIKVPTFTHIHVLDEKYLNMGDYLLVFENPDHPDYQFRKNVISFENMQKDFDKSFDVDCAFESINEWEELYRLAFFNCFDRLKKPPSHEWQPLDRHSDACDPNTRIYLVDESGKQVRVRGDDSRRMGAGGFLRENAHGWERTGEPIYDVCTLLRVFMLYKLSEFGGFFIRQFMSQNGTKIIAVLFQEIKNLKIEAERIGLKKRVNLAYCDILSLEPVDESYRPLRLNHILTSKYFEHLPISQQEVRKEVIKLLELINYNKLVKECRQAPYEAVGEIFQQQQIKIGTWQAYIFYLRKLSVLINRIREKYKKLNNPNLLSKVELHQLMHENKSVSFKSRSNKKYVRLQDQDINVHKRQLKELLIHKRAKEYREAMMEAHKETTKTYGHKLMNIWDRCNAKPVGPFIEYFQSNKKKNFNSIIQANNLWTTHIINERGKQSLFNKMERAKLCSSIINQLMNVEYLSKQDIIVDQVIPNSQFDLDGSRQANIHKKVKQAVKQDPNILFSALPLMKLKAQFLAAIKNEEKVPDDEESQPLNKTRKQQPIQGGIGDCDNLQSLWSLINPPILHLAEYYGERIALYFMYLYYTIYELLPISFFGVVTFVVQFLYEPFQIPYRVSLIFYTFLIVFWASTFEALWIKKEMEFQTMFGLEDIDSNQIELVGFVGKPKRSIATDKVNELQFSSSTTWFRFSIGLVVVMIFICIELVIIVALQYTVIVFEQEKTFPHVPFIELEVFIPALIQIVAGILLDHIFRPFAFRFTKWENHKYLSQFESSFVIKNLLFSTVNRLGTPCVIAFINGEWYGCVNGNDCYEQLQIYMRVAFFIEFGKNMLFDFVFPLLKQIYQRTRLTFTQIIACPQLLKDSPYYPINQSLETELSKESFTIDQVDGTIWEYLELSLQFALLTNFGSPFPLVFLMAFGMNVFELLVDKFKFLFLTKRPVPQSARSIGTFVHYLNLISYLGIFTNSALLAYTNENTFQDLESFTIFIILLFGFFIFKFITDLVYQSSDSAIFSIRQRHKWIKRKLNVGHSIKHLFSSEPSYPILKIYGTLLSWQKKEDQQ